jgi:four helix bundle protein
MNETNNKKTYDLEERTKEFAKSVRCFVRKLSKTTANFEDGKQVIRSSGSIGANYIEANESLSKKDFVMRIKICLKESKETAYWLDIIVDGNSDEFKEEGLSLGEEAVELKKIFSSILVKSG